MEKLYLLIMEVFCLIIIFLAVNFGGKIHKQNEILINVQNELKYIMEIDKEIEEKTLKIEKIMKAKETLDAQKNKKIELTEKLNDLILINQQYNKQNAELKIKIENVKNK